MRARARGSPPRVSAGTVLSSCSRPLTCSRPIRAGADRDLSAGPEFTVAILGNGEEARCLPIIGMLFICLPEGAPPFMGTRPSGSGYTEQSARYLECPANISKRLAAEIREAALGAYTPGMPRLVPRRRRCDAAFAPGRRAQPLPGILPDPRTIPVFPKPPRRLEWATTNSSAPSPTCLRRISGRSLLAEVAE